jgi:hypothetical protein
MAGWQLAVALALVAGCSDKGNDSGAVVPGPLVEAWAQDGCAPDDGRALMLRLNTAASACDADWLDTSFQLELLLFGSPATAGSSHDLADSGSVFVSALIDGRAATGVSSGTLWIDVAGAAGGSISGHYQVELQVDDAIDARSGSFVAPWCAADGKCG